MDVVETDVAQGFEFLTDRRYRSHELKGVEHRHIEDLSDALALVLYFERVAVVALARTYFAGDINVGQEVHFDADDAIALTRLAASALDVEREAAGSVTPHPRLRKLSKQLANGREQAGVGCGIRSRRAADGALIDVDDLVEMFHTLDAFDGAGAFATAAEFL